MNEYQDFIDKKVIKKSKKPFKSNSKINTVKNITINPNTNKSGFTFYEDESIVDCHQCELYELKCV